MASIATAPSVSPTRVASPLNRPQCPEHAPPEGVCRQGLQQTVLGREGAHDRKAGQEHECRSYRHRRWSRWRQQSGVGQTEIGQTQPDHAAREKHSRRELERGASDQHPGQQTADRLRRREDARARRAALQDVDDQWREADAEGALTEEAEPDGDEDGSQRPVLADQPQACPPLVTILPHADAPSAGSSSRSGRALARMAMMSAAERAKLAASTMTTAGSPPPA